MCLTSIRRIFNFGRCHVFFCRHFMLHTYVNAHLLSNIYFQANSSTPVEITPEASDASIVNIIPKPIKKTTLIPSQNPTLPPVHDSSSDEDHIIEEDTVSDSLLMRLKAALSGPAKHPSKPSASNSSVETEDGDDFVVGQGNTESDFEEETSLPSGSEIGGEIIENNVKIFKKTLDPIKNINANLSVKSTDAVVKTVKVKSSKPLSSDSMFFSSLKAKPSSKVWGMGSLEPFFKIFLFNKHLFFSVEIFQ